MRNKILKSSLYCINRSDLKNLTFSEIQGNILKDMGFLKKIICLNSSIKGSNAYWYKRSLELKDMINQLGPPTLFITISAADLHWKYLFQYLGKINFP